MLTTITHRGPDDSGVEGGEGWALGLNRLAIQDTSSGGHQPMRRHGLTIAYNGEVYNFPELRQELAKDGYSFASGSDTEVVLHAFHRWGTSAFERLNGMFALAIVNDRSRRIWLARDRFGKKPLFLAQLGKTTAFASELKAIIAVAREKLSIDRTSLAQYFGLQYVPGPATIFEHVEKVPPGSWTVGDLDTGAFSEPHSFWTLPVSTHGRGVRDPEEVLDRVRESVARRLIADVPVGAFLSGGTDSSLVVACMRDVASDVRTFSIGFDDPRYDESHYATAVARHLETNHTHHTLTQEDALAIIPRLPRTYDEPFADSSAIPTMAVSELARREVTVALSGDGGDELFGGYLRYRAKRFLRIANPLPVGATKIIPEALPGQRLKRRVSLFKSLASAPSPGVAYQDLVSVWRRQQLAELMPGAPPTDAVATWFDSSSGGLVEQMMRTDARTYLVDDILQKVDRASMAVSLEARNPLLDPAVVELAFQNVDRAEDNPGLKPVLRDALRLRLPHELVDRPKMGFGLPVGRWLREELKPMVEDLVCSRQAAEYDTDTARAVCRRHLSGATDASPRVWSLLAFELWRDEWEAVATGAGR